MTEGKETKMKFSVVIPLYNKGHHIIHTIESVLNQKHNDYEVLVVDDGSTDDSAEKVKQIQSTKIRIFQQKNQGVSVARNVGIENATGEYIAFLDADDAWKPDYLETVAGLISRYPESDIFVTAYEVLMKDGRVNVSTRREPEEGYIESYWETLGEKYDFVWTSATVVRRTALQKAGMFKPGERIGQDLDMWARVARNNPKVSYSSKVCVEYTRNAQENARTRVKIAYAKAFLQDLEEELDNPAHTEKELEIIQKKYDLKMTVYIFTSIMAGEKKMAYQALKNWKGTKNKTNRFLRFGLRVAYYTPSCINQAIYRLRLKLF
jgi:glycosyltransferase involved in cell wall biosynthesis